MKGNHLFFLKPKGCLGPKCMVERELCKVFSRKLEVSKSPVISTILNCISVIAVLKCTDMDGVVIYSFWCAVPERTVKRKSRDGLEPIGL